VPLGGASRLHDQSRSSTDFATDTVAVAALDDLIPPSRRISIIHFDIEGHEERALTGCLRCLRRWLPIVIVETMPGSEWIQQCFAPLQYRACGRIERNYVFAHANSSIHV